MIRAFDKWLLPWLRQQCRGSRAQPGGHVFLTVCDHFEPFHDASRQEALERVQRWHDQYEKCTAGFPDASGRLPRHTFFHPIEQYDPDVLNLLAALCRRTGCETEVHLHHKDDTAETLRQQLRSGLAQLKQHGLLTEDRQGTDRFAFIHGNWALANCHPEGKNCGVKDEIRVLREEGCYADLTFPSAPSPTQPRVLNTAGYVTESGSPAALDSPVPAETGRTSHFRNDSDKLLMIHGPLALNWKNRKFGLIPRVENADITGANPPTAARMQLWRQVAPSVIGLPSWQFVKLHTHGGVPRNAGVFLGDAMRRFHTDLAAAAREHGFHPHFVTAREMVNLIHAAEDGATGDPAPWFDYLFRKSSTASAYRAS